MEKQFTLNEDTYVHIYLKCGTGILIDNITIYPMIRPVDTSPDYVPWCMSNQELTKKQVSDDILLANNAKKNYFNLEKINMINHGNTSHYVSDEINGIVTTGNATGGVTEGWFCGSLYSTSDDMIVSFDYKITSGVRAVIGYEDRDDRLNTLGDGEWHHHEEKNYSNAFICYAVAPETDFEIDIKNIMIRPAGTSPDYVPYMMSNLELSAFKTYKTYFVAESGTTFDANGSYCYVEIMGKIVIVTVIINYLTNSNVGTINKVIVGSIDVPIPAINYPFFVLFNAFGDGRCCRGSLEEGKICILESPGMENGTSYLRGQFTYISE